MRVLAIETATAAGSVAIYDGETMIAERLPRERDQGRALASTVERLIGDIASISGYAISIGPGSFTGLRVGLSLLKGIAIVHPKPAAPISTLTLLKEQARRTGATDPILAVLDARAGEVFAAFSPRIPEGLHLAETVAALLDGAGFFAGDRIPILEAALPEWSLWPIPEDAPLLASILAELGRASLLLGEGREVQSLEPAYLQPAAVDRRL